MGALNDMMLSQNICDEDLPVTRGVLWWIRELLFKLEQASIEMTESGDVSSDPYMMRSSTGYDPTDFKPTN